MFFVANLEDRIVHYTNKRRIIKVGENEEESGSSETNDKKQKTELIVDC